MTVEQLLQSSKGKKTFNTTTLEKHLIHVKAFFKSAARAFADNAVEDAAHDGGRHGIADHLVEGTVGHQSLDLLDGHPDADGSVHLDAFGSLLVRDLIAAGQGVADQQPPVREPGTPPDRREIQMQPMNDADFMTLMAAIEALNDANARAAEWERYAHEVEANRDQWVNHANNLEVEVKDLADKLGVERAHSTGLKAVVDSFKVAHPDSPLLEQAGAAFKSPEVAGVSPRPMIRV